MTKYASYNSTVAAPSPVTGWYDTEEFNYPDLPEAVNLLLLTDDQWAAHTNGFWSVSGNTLVQGTPVTIPLLPG